jgi:hypothetical protein
MGKITRKSASTLAQKFHFLSAKAAIPVDIYLFYRS